MNKKVKKNIFMIVVGILILVLLYFVYNYVTNQKSEDIVYLKNYQVNEYIPTYISDEDMAKIYLNDYIHTMYYDIKAAYDLLDNEYKKKKFGSFNNYEKYVKSLKNSTYEVKKFYKKNIEEYTIFGVYDKNGNFFAFKTNGVMQYSVYLDDYTVEI